MKNLSVALLALFGVLVSGYNEDKETHGSSPWFCHKLDCPEYTLVKKHETFEERYYNASRWMTTDVEGNYKSAVNKGFMRLFYYIGGNNEAGIKIPMTAPVAVVVHPSTIDGNPKNISVSFFVPAKSIPPKPNDLTIHELNLTGSTMYVRSFGGFALESDWTENAQALEADLKAAGISYDPVSYVAAGYDSPFRLFNRHNEVWFHGLKMENAEKTENA